MEEIVVQYRETCGLLVHEAAAFCIGRRFFGCGERLHASIAITVGRPRERVPVRYVWASIYGYAGSADLRREPPGRKGSAGAKLSRPGQAVFIGHLASSTLGTPWSRGCDGVRKGGEPGGNPGATGNRVTPAPSHHGWRENNC